MIVLQNVSKTYQSGKIKFEALKKINLRIAPGEFVAIMGPSGSGKSTLMNLIGCLDTPSEGLYYLDKKEISSLKPYQLAKIRNQFIGFVFQKFHLLPYLSAYENIELPLVYTGHKYKNAAVEQSLNQVGLFNWKKHLPTELSGGQQQRIAIARALANQPQIILADEPTGNLDSATGQEIMNLLQELNGRGITVILVTHDEKTASYARRRIHIQDGEIVKDSNESESQSSPENKIPIFTKTSPLSFKKIKQNVGIALKSIAHKKTRTFLTTLGILIGIASVISMISLGEGSKKKVMDNISKMGSNLLYVSPEYTRRGVRSSAQAAKNRVYSNDADHILRECSMVESVTPILYHASNAVYLNQNMDTTVEGVYPDFPAITTYQMKYGRFFDEKSVRLNENVAVVGNSIVRDMFNGKNPVGLYIRIQKVNFLIIGALEEKGASSRRDEDNIILVPVTTAQKQLVGIEHVSLIVVKVKEESLLDPATEEIREIVRRTHRIGPKEPSDFIIQSQKEWILQVEENTKTFTILLVGIASISLLVGGIGIMNIMLVSVMERVKEIGIRKSIGAQRSDILSQFLTESVIVCFLGGILGIILGVGLSHFISSLAETEPVISAYSLFVAFGFSFTIGVFFGFYPAFKASKLNPIDALRSE